MWKATIANFEDSHPGGASPPNQKNKSGFLLIPSIREDRRNTGLNNRDTVPRNSYNANGTATTMQPNKAVFNENYRKVATLNADKNTNALAMYIKEVRTRILKNENKAVDPILDTFDMLHLQEIDLRMKSYKKPDHIKNNRPHHKLTSRRGGKRNKKARKKVEHLLLYGYCPPKNSKFRDDHLLKLQKSIFDKKKRSHSQCHQSHSNRSKLNTHLLEH